MLLSPNCGCPRGQEGLCDPLGHSLESNFVLGTWSQRVPGVCNFLATAAPEKQGLQARSHPKRPSLLRSVKSKVVCMRGFATAVFSPEHSGPSLSDDCQICGQGWNVPVSCFRLWVSPHLGVCVRRQSQRNAFLSFVGQGLRPPWGARCSVPFLSELPALKCHLDFSVLGLTRKPFIF